MPNWPGAAKERRSVTVLRWSLKVSAIAIATGGAATAARSRFSVNSAISSSMVTAPTPAREHHERMRTTKPAATAVIILALAACGSAVTSSHPASTAPASPKLSAATACADFRSWYLGTQPDLSDTAKMADLLLATASAPSGPLYQDLSTLESDVITTSKATGSLQQAEENATVLAASQVEQDCETVNPAS